MKIVITESQYRKLQRHLRKQELNEASFGKTLGMAAALAGGLSTSSMAQKYDRDVKPTGRFTYSYNQGDTMSINNNVLTFNNAETIDLAMTYVFNQRNFINETIPVKMEGYVKSVDDISNLDFIKQRFELMLKDTLFGGENTKGTFFFPSGYQDERDIKKSGFLRLLGDLFRKQNNVKIRKVIFDDVQFKQFMQMILDNKTEFVIEDGFLYKT
jgi:hypothetical protein